MIVPHASVGPYGELILEWFGPNSKAFTLYFDEDKVVYLKSWGPDTEAQMVEGDLPELHNLVGWVGSNTNE